MENIEEDIKLYSKLGKLSVFVGAGASRFLECANCAK